MNTSTSLAELCADFQARYAAHTVLLYGSLADGTASPDSDVDIAVFAPVSIPIREAYVRDGVFIDAFVYPESVLDDPAEEHLRFRGSKILLQSAGTADAFLARLDQQYATGPAPLADDERDARRVWIEKMLVRISRGDAEGDYRRAWLLTSLLEDYFLLRGLWFQGPKKALIWLRENDPQTADAMEVALKPGADIAAIEAAATRVLDDE
ncbi:nucleotidyltransferase domain-containing protein [Salinicola sp. V024]|uniref:nucleotidyltransferase domain-containing protein n=1 Tax=Salinicola TaxID=404432 RepID=UPI003F489B18